MESIAFVMTTISSMLNRFGGIGSFIPAFMYVFLRIYSMSLIEVDVDGNAVTRASIL